jgi:hypothetical protein
MVGGATRELCVSDSAELVPAIGWLMNVYI